MSLCPHCGTNLIPIAQSGYVWKDFELKHRNKEHTRDRCFEVLKSQVATLTAENEKMKPVWKAHLQAVDILRECGFDIDDLQRQAQERSKA